MSKLTGCVTLLLIILVSAAVIIDLTTPPKVDIQELEKRVKVIENKQNER